MHAAHVLRRHPIPITCRIEHSLVVTWALPIETLEPLVPRGLSLDVHDRWGFVAVAVVQTRDLRPTGLPALVGRDYALTGYRLFVRHRDANGRTRRGLHILRSDTDKRSMQLGGNLCTRYGYQLATIDLAAADDRFEVRITSATHDADLHVVADFGGPPAGLPDSSPFTSMAEARRFSGPLPWTFDHEPETDSIVMVHGRRSTWHPEPAAVEVTACSFLDHGPFVGADARLANAFHVADVDYAWERGTRVPNRTVDRPSDEVAA